MEPIGTEVLNKYKDLPYKHLGDDPTTGLDCFNLIKLIYKEQLNIDIPYSTSDICTTASENWYNEITDIFNPFGEFRNPKWGWVEVDNIQPYDVILLYIGATNVPNHVGLYAGNNKFIQIINNKKSNISPYGKYYKQYTDGVFRWKQNIQN